MTWIFNYCKGGGQVPLPGFSFAAKLKEAAFRFKMFFFKTNDRTETFMSLYKTATDAREGFEPPAKFSPFRGSRS